MCPRSTLLLQAALCVVLALAFSGGVTRVEAADNIALQWYELQDRVLFAPLGSGPVRGPNRATAVGQSRAIFLLTSAVYDAWAVYDSKAIPSTYRYEQSKVPRMRGSSADINKAISYAAYRLFEFMHVEEPLVLEAAKAKLQSLGYDPAVNGTDTKTPAGVGNFLAARIIGAARLDGTNSEGDHPGSIHPNEPYADYSNYQPMNAPKSLEEIKNDPCKGINSLDHWTPLKEDDGTVQEFNVPYMPFVTPFALNSATEVVMPGPPMPNTAREAEFRQQFFDLFAYSANLTDVQKVDAEFWAYASGSELFYKITFDSARNLKLSLPDTVKLLFAQGVAVWDAAVSCWTYKRIYTSGRPTTVIPCLFANTTAEAWMGPYQGRGLINGSHWQPYIATPPFSEYPSGHSTFTAASAVVLQRFLKSDVYHGNPVVVPEGASFREPKITNTSDPRYIAGVTDKPNTGPGTPGYVPATNITLTWKTYSEAAVAAGESRIHAGFHIKSGNEDALAAGSEIGEKVWLVCTSLWDPPASSSQGSKNSGDDDVGGKIAGAVIGSIVGTLIVSALVVVAVLYIRNKGKHGHRGYSSDYVAYSS